MELKLNVKGMHCTSCEMLIKESLEETDGVRSAKAHFKDGKVIVSFDEKRIDEAKIKEIIKKEGYTV
jgi:copper chaperone CopZ